MSSRFPPRDRSPHRYGDRRPHIPAGPRGGEDVNSVPLGREPPRGPKALIDSSRGGHFSAGGPRGRGIPPRGDYRERDPRDMRDAPHPFRREIERDWPRRDRSFDPRDSRPPHFDHVRSRSPPPLRDFREGPRDLDIPRLRRGSRDGPPMLPDLSPIRGGSLRGRGRGDRDRGRGKVFLDDRDLFRRRSLSRDPWPHRDVRFEREREREREWERERGRELERRDRFERREDDRRSDRDERDRLLDRPLEAWKKDRMPSRIDPRPSSNATTISPSTASPSSSALFSNFSRDEIAEAPPRPSVSPAVASRDQPKPAEKQDLPPTRQEFSANQPVPQFSAPSLGPTFGSSSATPSTVSIIAPLPPPSAPFSKGRTPSVTTPASKSLADSSASKPARPPTGPRAARNESSAGSDVRSRPPPPLDFSVDSQSKHDVPLRPSRPPPISPVAPHAAPFPSRPRASSLDKVSQSSSRNEESSFFPPRSNSGPLSPTGPASVAPQRSGRNSLDLSASSPIAHRRPSSTIQTSPRAQFSNVPTGPRAFQRPNAPRSGPKNSNTWHRPGYANRGPHMIPPASPTKREHFGEEKDFGSSASNEARAGEKKQDDALRSEDSSNQNWRKQLEDAINEKSTGEPSTSASEIVAPSEIRSHGEEGAAEAAAKEKHEEAIPDLLAGSSGEASDEEDEDDLDEEDFNQGELRFEKEMQDLAAELPRPPLQDPEVVSLLLKIQMLGMITDEAVLETLDEAAGDAMQVDKAEEAAPAPTEAAAGPSQDKKEKEKEKEKEVEEETKAPEAPSIVEPPALQPAVSEPIAPPTVEDLPFIHTGPPTPFSDMESYQETLRLHENIRDTLREELLKRQDLVAKQHEELRQEYRAYYRPWRIAVAEMDRKKAAEEKTAPTELNPSTPPSATVATAPANPVTEGRRGYRLNSELDFQNALKASTITAEEENARRKDMEATARPDLAREAPIPDMLDQFQKKAEVFQDTNHLVDPAKAFEVFAYELPIDDFTPEEHKIFTDTFLTHPKRWGRIAQALPGRNFQQCINHYYQTKEEMKYKAKLNKRWARRGRGRRTVPRPPKSNALMADLGVRPLYDGDETGETTPAVTDTGRPRRAAAPTFGELAADTENSTPTPGSGRRSGNDQPTEKPRRGGRGGGRGGRRARTQHISNTPIAAAPPKSELEVSVEQVVDFINSVPRNEEPVPRGLLPPPAAVPTPAPRGRPSRSRMKEKETPAPPIMEPDAAAVAQSELAYGSQQPNSYWSVPEQKDFPELLAHFGRDFEAIAAHMKTKTPTMVRNYFQRCLDSGKSELGEMAAAAEAKKSRGEPTAPLPAPPIIPAKRRFDNGPAAANPRPLAPQAETPPEVVMVAERKAKPHTMTAAPQPIQPRQPVEKAIAQQQAYYASVQARLAAQIATAAAAGTAARVSNEDFVQRARQQATQSQRVQQGPRMGYFSDSRTEVARAAPAQPTLPSALQEQRQQQQQGIGPLPSQTMSAIHAQNAARHNVPPHDPEFRNPQGYQPIPQSSYLQQRSSLPVNAAAQSRRPSRGISSTVASPVQLTIKVDPSPRVASSAERMNQPSNLYRQAAQFHDPGRPNQLVGRPSPRANPATLQANEPPSQVPVKRSNIMSILNDEPEEPQPRKRFASGDYPGSSATPRPVSPRAVYGASRPNEQKNNSAQPTFQPPQYASAQPSHGMQPQQQTHPSVASGQQYSEYSGGFKTTPTGGSSVSQDWMARFDPRQQQQQPQQSSSTDSRARPSSTAAINQMYTAQLMDMQRALQQQHQPFPHQPATQQQAALQGQSSSSRASPMPQHPQSYSQPGSPSVQRHSISYAPKSSHPKPASPMQSSHLNPSSHQPQGRHQTYGGPGSTSQQMQPPEIQPFRQQGGPASQQFASNVRRVPSVSPRHQHSYLPSQHLQAQQELQAQRAQRISMGGIGPQQGGVSAGGRQPPTPSQIQNLNRGQNVPLERSYTPPTAMQQQGQQHGAGVPQHQHPPSGYPPGTVILNTNSKQTGQQQPPPGHQMHPGYERR